MLNFEASETPKSCWVVSDGRRGIENQALGLAEAVQAEAGSLGGAISIHLATVRKGGFVALPDAPPPDLWIGCGRAAVGLAGKHRHIFPKCFFTYVQDPRQHYDAFDLIIAPSHDRLARNNAIAMIGSPNRVSAAQLDTAQQDFAAELDALPGPRAAVLIGGDSKRFKLAPAIGEYLEHRLEALLAQDISLMVTVSRRTPAAIQARLKARLAGHDRVWFHDGDGPNPYFAFLAAADWIFVTEESTNMLVEAATVGKPVYALPMAGTPGKFARLHAALEGCDALRPWLGQLDSWSYKPLAETRRVARLLIDRWMRQIATQPILETDA
jgi:mitochondrial fission protein ELM1